MASSHIDEKTKISLFAVVVSLSTIVLAAMWLAVLSTRTEQALASSIENERKMERQTQIMLEIKERLIRIEEKIIKGSDK